MAFRRAVMTDGPTGKQKIGLCVGFTLGVLCLLAGIALFIAMDPYMSSVIKKKVVIASDSKYYHKWVNTSLPIYMQFWLFHVTNPEEVLKGGKPSLVEKGPYTYSETRNKFDINWNEDSSVTFKQNIAYHFVPEMSVGLESDEVTTVNPLIPTFTQMMKSDKMKHMPPAMAQKIGMVLQNALAQERLFMTRPVGEVLFGYESQALTMMKMANIVKTTTAGYFSGKNNTNDGTSTIFTGEDDIDKLCYMKSYKNKTNLDVWTSKSANMVKGSDASRFPPDQFDTKKAFIFVPQLCRSIYGVYQDDVRIHDIRLRRFGHDQKLFANAQENPDNLGFCVPAGKCLPTGLLNGASCSEFQTGRPLPIIFSFPHFLDADDQVINSVDGLSPKRADHQTFLDIEPHTGLIFRAGKKLQINIFVEKSEKMPMTGNVQRLFFPVVWINESYVFSEESCESLKSSIFTPMEIAKLARIVLSIVGGLLIVIFIGIYFKLRNQRTMYATEQERSPALPLEQKL